MKKNRQDNAQTPEKAVAVAYSRYNPIYAVPLGMDGERECPYLVSDSVEQRVSATNIRLRLLKFRQVFSICTL